ncbi:MAG: BMP family ABC transporter substrate-binding protein, partial [Clostridia bacterium]|nr:BMP family ABC transporter substrate-binding protein [Clostridia bacterium]
MKRILAVLLAAMMLFAFVACTPAEDSKDLKVGFIFLHDENSTYDLNFINAAKEACQKMGVEYVQKTQIPESNDCYTAAVELIESDGCTLIFADSFGHESFLMKAAAEYPDVEFCHATGTQAHTSDLKNFHNAFASIYEGRYL